MELRHLRYFVAVAESLHFRRAAETLRVAQPALSKQIRDLEHELGTRLFDRDTTRVLLTPAGGVLLEAARRMLGDAARLPALLHEVNEGRRGHITIGNVGAVSAGLLPAALTAFRRSYPDVDVTLLELRSQEQAAALLAGTIHIGLIGGLQPPGDGKLDCVLLSRSPIRVFLDRAHPLAPRTSLSLEMLARDQLLAITRHPTATEHAELLRSIFSGRGLNPPPVKPVDSLESLLALIAGGHGVSLLPRSISTQRSVGLLTKPLKEDGEDLFFNLWAAWRRQESSKLVHNFVDLLRAQAKSPA